MWSNSNPILYLVETKFTLVLAVGIFNLITTNCGILIIINNIQSAYDYLRGEKIIGTIICALPEHNVYNFKTLTCNFFDDGFMERDTIWNMPRIRAKNRLAVCPVYYVSFMLNGIEYKDFCVVNSKQRYKFMNEQVEFTYLYDLKEHKPVPQSPIGYIRIIFAFIYILLGVGLTLFAIINF